MKKMIIFFAIFCLMTGCAKSKVTAENTKTPEKAKVRNFYCFRKR